MKSFSRLWIALLIAGWGCLCSSQNDRIVKADGVISVETLDVTYVQNFDTLVVSGESQTLPTGWLLLEDGGSANASYMSSTGSLAAADTYSYGSTGSSDRAFGMLQNDTLAPMIGAHFVNNTGGVIQQLEVGFTGEEWRCGKTNRIDKLLFEYSTDATSLQSGSWTRIDALEFRVPNNLSTGAKNGNLVENRQVFNPYTITGLAVADGQSFWVRWVDHNSTIGEDDGLAIDDFSLVARGLDHAPSVVSHTPVDGANKIALDSTISLTFSEPVDLISGWLTLQCSTSGVHTVNLKGGPTIFTLTPDQLFSYGETCSITLDDAKISDQDQADPPNNLDNDFSFTFSTETEPDMAPRVLSIQPGNNAQEVSLTQNITIQFSEPISAVSDWVQLGCSKSGTHELEITVKDDIYTLQPKTPFVFNESCTIQVNADKVTDLDAEDPPDQMNANVVSSFNTVENKDTPPELINTFPKNGDTAIPLDQKISLEFSESVNLSPGWFEMTCSKSGIQTAILEGGPIKFEIDLLVPLQYDETCSVKILADKVTDVDSYDPPDQMPFDQGFEFASVHLPDEAPTILGSLPVNHAVEVAVDSNLIIEFSEPIEVVDQWVDLDCSKSGSHELDVLNEGQVYTLDPKLDFAQDEACDLSIFADSVHDIDSDDPPDLLDRDVLIQFTTAPIEDEAPHVVSTLPMDGATGVQTNGLFRLNFSEAVILNPGWVDILCNKSGTHFVVLSDGPQNYSFSPLTDFVYQETCEVTLHANLISDRDDLDPPDRMNGNYSFSFTTMDDPNKVQYPVVDTSVPKDGDVLDTPIHNLLVQFSEDVLHDGGEDAADNPQNYRFVSAGPDQELETNNCEGPAGDDFEISIDSIDYESTTYQAALTVNQGIDLLPGKYRLIICGSHTIRDSEGYAINDGLDTFISFRVVEPSGGGGSTVPGDGTIPDPTDSPAQDATIQTVNAAVATPTPRPLMIPVTGFAPNRFTILPEQSIQYSNPGDVWLEIPSMDLELPIVAVPLVSGEWDVTWLNNQAGWLEGSAFPTFKGNSVLTAHVWDAWNQAGPFFGLQSLKYNDRVIIHAWGEDYIYAIREVKKVLPSNVNAMMKHQDSAWLTLITCQGYDEENNSYSKRIMVRAVLLEIK